MNTITAIAWNEKKQSPPLPIKVHIKPTFACWICAFEFKNRAEQTVVKEQEKENSSFMNARVAIRTSTLACPVSQALRGVFKIIMGKRERGMEKSTVIFLVVTGTNTVELHFLL